MEHFSLLTHTQNSTHFIGDKDLASSLNAVITAELSFQSLNENSRTPSPGPCYYPLILNIQTISHIRQYLRYHILSLNRINNSLYYSSNTRNRELNASFQSTAKILFEETANFVGLVFQLIPASSQIKHLTFPIPFALSKLHITSTDEASFRHQWGSITFYNFIYGLILNYFLKPNILFSLRRIFFYCKLLKQSFLKTQFNLLILYNTIWDILAELRYRNVPKFHVKSEILEQLLFFHSCYSKKNKSLSLICNFSKSSCLLCSRFTWHSRMDWCTNSRPLSKELGSNESKRFICNPKETDSAAVSLHYINGSFTYFDILSFQVQIEKKHNFFTIIKLSFVHTGVFTNQPTKYDGIVFPKNSQSRCSASFLWRHFVLNNWREIPRIWWYFKNSFFESHFLRCLHFDGFCQPTPKHVFSIVRAPEENHLIYHISGFVRHMSERNNRYWLETNDFFISTGKNSQKNVQRIPPTMLAYSN